MIQEPVVVFTNNAVEGRKLAKEKDWYFYDGNARDSATVAQAFRAGIKNGIITSFYFTAMGLNLDRPDNSVVLVGNPSIAEGFQATRAAGVRQTVRDIDTRPVYSFKTIDQLRLRLGKHDCRCPMQMLNARGCQCGGK